MARTDIISSESDDGGLTIVAADREALRVWGRGPQWSLVGPRPEDPGTLLDPCIGSAIAPWYSDISLHMRSPQCLRSNDQV